MSGRVRLTASAFFTRINDLIDQTGNTVEIVPTGMFEGVVPPVMVEEIVHVNRGSASATGVEGEAEYRSATGVLARGSLVAQRATDRAEGQSLSNAPEHLGTLQLAVPLATREVTLALDSTFVGRRLTRTGRQLNSFWLANVIATWQPRHASFMVQGGFQNLFNEAYAAPRRQRVRAGRHRPGRADRVDQADGALLSGAMRERAGRHSRRNTVMGSTRAARRAGR